MTFDVNPFQFFLLALQRSERQILHDQIHFLICRLQHATHNGVLQKSQFDQKIVL